MAHRVSGYDDVVRDRAMAIVRARSKPIDRRLLLVAVRRSLNLPITKREFARIMRGYLSAEVQFDERGRRMALTLDLPERVECGAGSSRRLNHARESTGPCLPKASRA